MLQRIAEVATIAMKPPGTAGVADVVQACEIVREMLGAEDAYVIRAGDPYFMRIGGSRDPGEYEIKQKGYWLIWKELARATETPGGIFKVADGFVADDSHVLEPGRPGTYIATILPGNESNSEILIVRGPWPGGLTDDQFEIVCAVRPVLAYLVGNLLDAERRSRQRRQLGALSEVAAAFSEAKEVGDVLQAVTTALSKASGFDWVSIYLFDEGITRVTDGATNLARHSDTNTGTVYSASNRNQLDGGTIRMARRLARTRVPELARDVFDFEVKTEVDLALVRFYERSHILSAATFPMLFQDRLIGTAVFLSSTSCGFEKDEVAFLTGLVSQAATTIRAFQLSREFRETDQRLRAIFANAPVLTTVFDRDGVVQLMEGLRLALPAESLSRHVGRSIHEGLADLPAAFIADVAGAVDRCLAGEHVRTIGQLIGRWFETQYAPLRDEAGETTGVIGISLDITEQRNAEQELLALNRRLGEAHASALELAERAEASARAKSEFIANTSHEIRTPMNGVVGMTSLLLDTRLSNDQREYVETIRQSADALMSVIDEILDFSKLEAGKMRIEAGDFDLRGTFEEVADLLAPVAQKKGLELTLSLLPPEFPSRLRGDAGRLRQVLMNLVGNAIKFTDEGEVDIRAVALHPGPTHVTLRLEVKDTGIGIPLERQAAVFESFTQADGTSTRRHGGTGLGLTISKQIVELMGGRIGVESEPGAGSTFWAEVTLERQAKLLDPVSLPAAFLGKRVLVVDDNATNRMILREQLAAWGCRPVEAASGVEALAKLRATPDGYALILMDFQMPEMDGLQTMSLIRREPAIAHVPVVLLSSAGAHVADEEGSELFAAALTKPVRQSHLYNTILEVLATGEATVQAPVRADFVARRRLGLHVLLAEDNAINQKVAVRMLQRWDCEVEAMADGDGAVAALERGTFDVVLMDCHMPGLDGYKATMEIRRRERGTGNHIPIIAMTANALEGDRDRCLAVGMDDYVRKPVKPEELWKVLQLWSERADAARPEGLDAPPKALDLDCLSEACNGDEELMAELEDEFARTAAEAFESVVTAVREGDASALVLAAHSFKGACWAIGGTALGGVLARLEGTGKANELQLAASLLGEARAELTRLQQALASRGEARAA